MRLLILLVPLLLVSCSALDWATGADKPTITEDGASIAPAPAPIDTALDTLKGTGPIGAGAAALLAYLAGQYRERRRKEKG